MLGPDAASQLIDGYKAGNELVKQLITLATGILALSITFTKDVLKLIPKATLSLKVAWLLYLLSIICGIWAMMAFTGMIVGVAIDGLTDTVKNDRYGSSVVPLSAQILSFVIATASLIRFGFKSLKRLAQTEREASSTPVEPEQSSK
jgi:hypothetical protein